MTGTGPRQAARSELATLLGDLWRNSNADRSALDGILRAADAYATAPAQPPSPEPDGTVTIGPECFASADRRAISWRGINYYPWASDPDHQDLAGPLEAENARLREQVAALTAEKPRWTERFGPVVACEHTGPHPALPVAVTALRTIAWGATPDLKPIEPALIADKALTAMRGLGVNVEAPPRTTETITEGKS